MDKATKQDEIERLLQLRRIELIEKPNAESFVCVYSREEPRNGFHTYCFLLPQESAEKFLKELGWTHRSGDFRPRLECVWESGEKIREVYYLSNGTDSGAQALVHSRHFWGLRSALSEVSEEFRLFHNLYHDVMRNVLLHCDVHAVEHEVVRISDDRVEIQLRFLVEFLRAKQMHLAMQWDGAYWCNYSLGELDLERVEKEQHGANFHWLISARDDLPTDECKCMSRLLGKALILCPGPVEHRNPLDEDGAAASSFIIGQNERGEPVTANCTPEVSNGFELEPVFFKRKVLRKYFDDPRTFSVEDGYLRCGSLWGLQLDNDHPKYVIVFLKDLQMLPAADREHWRSFNILPDGSMSETCFRRNIRAEFADPKMPDLQLKYLYPCVNKAWEKIYGWPLWCDPVEQDRYVFSQAHVCLSDDQAEFDQQNGLLAKLLNDFLNEDAIKAALKTQPANPGGLNRLQQFLLEAGHADADKRIRPLRTAQALRSSGSAHGKGSEYTKALERAELNKLPIIDASRKLFAGAVDFLEWLKADVIKNKS